MAAVLDPRFKLQMLKGAYDQLDSTTSLAKVELVRSNLVLLYNEYRSASSSLGSSRLSTSQTPHDFLTESPLEDMNDDLFELERCLESDVQNTKTNLDKYLDDDARLHLSSFGDNEVLTFWKEHQQQYGDLACMARDILSVPITTVASESAFSVGGRVLNAFRNRLLPRNVQALLCTRNWLRGFAEFEGDEEYFDDEEVDSSEVAESTI